MHDTLGFQSHVCWPRRASQYKVNKRIHWINQTISSRIFHLGLKPYDQMTKNKMASPCFRHLIPHLIRISKSVSWIDALNLSMNDCFQLVSDGSLIILELRSRVNCERCSSTSLGWRWWPFSATLFREHGIPYRVKKYHQHTKCHIT
jgi:hypothetical protein